MKFKCLKCCFVESANEFKSLYGFMCPRCFEHSKCLLMICDIVEERECKKSSESDSLDVSCDQLPANNKEDDLGKQIELIQDKIDLLMRETIRLRRKKTILIEKNFNKNKGVDSNDEL